MAQQGRDLTLVHVQVDVVDGQLLLVVLFGQALDLNASPQTDGLFLDVLGVPRRPLRTL